MPRITLFFFLLPATILCLPLPGRATDDGTPFDPIIERSDPCPYTADLSPQEEFLRTRKIFAHFSLPDEEAELAQVLERTQGRGHAWPAHPIRRRAFDPLNQLARFFSADQTVLQFFLDRDSRARPDFRWAKESEEARHHTHGLAGKKIILDPGHSGGGAWESRTGKFIRDTDGRVLSEAVLATQMAMLIRDELSREGAQVELTREKLGPVSSVDFQTFDLGPSADRLFRDSQYEPWFRCLLKAGDDDTLYSAFETSEQRGLLSGEGMRYRYFFRGYDLEARLEKLQRAPVDLVVVLHLDVAVTDEAPHGVNPLVRNQTKTYVPGGFLENEWGSSAVRAQAIWHLTNTSDWEASLEISRLIVQSISKRLDIPLQERHSPGGFAIEPGVFARNLNLTRRFIGAPISFVEGMFYNGRTEFEALSTPDGGSTLIEGRPYPTSHRLRELSSAIADGIRKYFAAGRGYH